MSAVPDVMDEYDLTPTPPSDPDKDIPDDSPNKSIDRAIRKMMKKIDAQPPDVAVKIIAQAINWERVKRQIKDGESDFDPDNLFGDKQ